MISRVIRAKWYLKGNILGIPCKPITIDPPETVAQPEATPRSAG